MTGEHDQPPMKAAPGKARIDESARQRLGQNLRLLYTSVLNQPLPDRFKTLLDALSATPPIQDEAGDREGSR